MTSSLMCSTSGLSVCFNSDYGSCLRTMLEGNNEHYLLEVTICSKVIMIQAKFLYGCEGPA
jgi:hypothetical protein